MHTKFIIYFLGGVLSTRRSEKICISPNLHKFFNAYRDYTATYEQNFPCCTNTTTKTQIPSDTTHTKNDNTFIKVNTSDKGIKISAQDIDNMLNFKIKRNRLYWNNPKEQVKYARKMLYIINTLTSLLYNSMLINVEKKKLKKIKFTFLKEGKGMKFKGTVINLLDEFLKKINDTYMCFFDLENDIIVGVVNDSRVIGSKSDVWMENFGFYMRDVIGNLIKNGVYGDFMCYFDMLMKYFDYFVVGTYDDNGYVQSF